MVTGLRHQKVTIKTDMKNKDMLKMIRIRKYSAIRLQCQKYQGKINPGRMKIM